MNQWIRKTDAADHMREVTKSGVTYLTFPVLDATGIVTHAFSTRMGGVSEGWYSTMNFSFTRGDNRCVPIDSGTHTLYPLSNLF